MIPTLSYRHLLLLLCSLYTCIAPRAYANEKILQRDTFFVAGANTEHLSQYVSYYVDSCRQQDIYAIDSTLKRGEFKHWPLYTTLNLGLNPYPLWLHLEVTNSSTRPKTYWWSLYNQADTIMVFCKTGEASFRCIDTLSYKIPQSQRPVRTRFQAIRLDFEANEHKTLLLKVINRRTPQYFITDLTSPVENLLWEKDFYWSVGIFTGCFLLIVVISLIMGFVAREKIFFICAAYVSIVLFILLSQELLLTILPEHIFAWLIRIHPLTAALIALCLHYHVVCYALGIKPTRHRLVFMAFKLNWGILGYAILIGLLHFIFVDHISIQQTLYLLLFYTSIGIVFLLLALLFVVILTSGSPQNRALHLLVAFIIVYFNPASYYLNYQGIIHYYKITYPNYFYWVLCTEFLALGIVVAWRYRQILRSNYKLLKERALSDKQAYTRELEIQELERKRIAQDLHDDLGATLSAIRLIITNNYSQDQKLVDMIVQANTDLRHFFTQLAPLQLKQHGLYTVVSNKIAEINHFSDTTFTFIPIGNENNIPEDFLLPLYRIVCELLTNILKHADAPEATLHIMTEDDQIQVLVEDNGIGYDVKSSSSGMGIRNIQERVTRISGDIHISSNQSGTTTIITIPF